MESRLLRCFVEVFPMKAATYSRVSTPDKQDVTMQTAELAEYVKARPWPLVNEYTD